MWSMLDSWWLSPCPNITFSMDDFTLAFLSMRCERSRLIPLGARTTEITNSKIWLIYQVGQSRACHQNYDEENASFLLVEDYGQIQIPWNHCLRQLDPIYQYHGHWLLQIFGSINKVVFVVHPQANGQAESANKIILKGLKRKLNDAKGL